MADASIITITPLSSITTPASTSGLDATGKITLNQFGTVTVEPNTPAGDYDVLYVIESTLNPGHTDDAILTVSVGAVDLNAANDDYRNNVSFEVNGRTGGTVTGADVWNNDTVNNGPIDQTQVTLHQLTVGGPLTVNTNGSVDVASGTPAGDYSVLYELDENLNNSNPVGLQVGVYNLPYFPDEYRFHFNAHNLVVYGKENGHYLISDPVMETVTTLTDSELEKVRFAKGALAPKGHMYYPTSFPEELELKKAIVKGIKHTCKDMLAPLPILGVKGIKYTAKLIRKWPKKIGPRKTNHYLGQIVRMQEEIGTGGGGFRYIFAAFLQESSAILDNPKLSELSKEMTAIGDQWRDFAVDASRIYKKRSGKEDMYNNVADQLDAIADKEKVFFKKLKKAVA